MSKEIINLNATFLATGNAVGKKEGEGPLGALFDTVDGQNPCGITEASHRKGNK